VSSPVWVLDTGALLAFAAGEERVGSLIADAADAEERIAIPVVCLLETYQLLDHDEHARLGPLRANAVVDVLAVDTSVRSDTAPTIGGMARHVGGLAAAQAVFLAIESRAGVVTSRPDKLRVVLGEQWSIVEI
jgi:predicted nucleic acid-binding protein